MATALSPRCEPRYHPVPDALVAAGRDTLYSDVWGSEFDGGPTVVAPRHTRPRHVGLLPRSRGTTHSAILAGKQYIDLRARLLQDLAQLADYYENISVDMLEQSLQTVLSRLASTGSIAAAASLTYEQSIYYTLRAGEMTFYLQHFLKADEEDDEALLAVFRGDMKLPSRAGTLGEVLSMMVAQIHPTNTRFIDVVNVLPR